MVGARAPGTEQISQRVSYFCGKGWLGRKAGHSPTELAWWTGSQGGGARARGGGARASVPGGVGGRGTGPRDGANFATCVVFLLFNAYKKKKNGFFLKDALWGGGGYPPELAWWTGG